MSFECPICFKEFSLNPDNTPKILRCGDTLCNKCLNQIIHLILNFVQKY